MFFARLNKMKVFDNREGFLGLSDRAELRIYSRVNAGLNPFLHVTLADFRELDNNPDGIAERLKTLLLGEAGDLAQCNYVEVNGVKDNDSLYFGDAGFLMYQDAQIPETLNVQLLVIEADDDIRKFAIGAGDVLDSPVVKGITGSILTALAAVNPVWTATVGIGRLAV
ncbi:MAG: hypothetical protein LBJ23_03520, partial [Tannerella sp.]|nr:hypothetical protein [Tannerella sp.]